MLGILAQGSHGKDGLIPLWASEGMWVYGVASFGHRKHSICMRYTQIIGSLCVTKQDVLERLGAEQGQG